MKRKLLKSCGTYLALSTVLYWAAAAAPLNARQQKKAPPPPAADVKVRTKMSMGGTESGMETLLYVKGARMRSEMLTAGMGMTNIQQCDLKRNISVNDRTRTYLITPMDETSAAAGGGGAVTTPGAPGPATETRRGGVVNIVNTITDTGERKQMFGFEARHLKTSMSMEASPDACNPGNTRVETDGWYIDFDFAFSCPGQPQTYTPVPVQTRPGCTDEIRTKTVGKARLGYPVLVTTTIHGKDGAAPTTMTTEVVELERAPLDAALFDVPAGYTLAANQMELYGMGGGVTAVAGGGRRNNDDASAGGPGAASSPAAATPAGMVSASAPKKEGAVRIGIVVPKAQMTAAGGAAQAAEAVRHTFAGYLNGPGVEVVALSARLPSQALAEARESQCDYVLYASLTQKKGGGGGMFGRALGNIGGAAVGHLPGGSTAGSAAARSVAISGVYTTASIASSIKAKDELSLEYKLEATDGARPGVAKTEKAKANSDGEDVLTPLVEKASGAITAAVKR